ncbi:hypothetical protein BDZ90DRAFT_259173 [Jaminaea rosea]|uniref:DUF1690-domain-containing protein n=1 Tax=Jaminaea rosea TaxID=1569628 RepID=A0A316UUX9_9BASI|nr:hypothetical protein BDZ90DRAFT_259173 [Jaminaea rosea]PWN29116.1 hypothetical protein BDZ90DRAFT_259173 [Jaminaea rosea]
MGAQASKPEASAPAAQQEKISLSQSMLNKISDATGGAVGGDGKQDSKQAASSTSVPSSSSSSSSTSSPLSDLLPATRQSKLDSSVRSQISSELSRLRKQEAAVQEEIRRKLEEENLAIEGKTGSSSSALKPGSSRTSSSLEAELASVRKRIERHDEGRKLVEQSSPLVKETRQKVEECYKKNQGKTLDCWKEARDFTAAVERAEKDLVAKLAV